MSPLKFLPHESSKIKIKAETDHHFNLPLTKNSAGSRAEISQAIVEIEERRGDDKYLKSDAKKTISKQSNIKI